MSEERANNLDQKMQLEESVRSARLLGVREPGVRMNRRVAGQEDVPHWRGGHRVDASSRLGFRAFSAQWGWVAQELRVSPPGRRRPDFGALFFFLSMEKS